MGTVFNNNPSWTFGLGLELKYLPSKKRGRTGRITFQNGQRRQVKVPPAFFVKRPTICMNGPFFGGTHQFWSHQPDQRRSFKGLLYLIYSLIHNYPSLFWTLIGQMKMQSWFHCYVSSCPNPLKKLSFSLSNSRIELFK